MFLGVRIPHCDDFDSAEVFDDDFFDTVDPPFNLDPRPDKPDSCNYNRRTEGLSNFFVALGNIEMANLHHCYSKDKVKFFL
jgi:hypothetical protein